MKTEETVGDGTEPRETITTIDIFGRAITAFNIRYNVQKKWT